MLAQDRIGARPGGEIVVAVAAICRVVAALGINVDLRELARRTANGELLEGSRVRHEYAADSYLGAGGDTVELDRFGGICADDLKNVVRVDHGGRQEPANFQLLKLKD